MTVVRDVLRHNLQVMMLAEPANVTEDAVDLHYANVRRCRFDGRRFSVSNRMAETLAQVVCPVTTVWGERDALHGAEEIAEHRDVEALGPLEQQRRPAEVERAAADLRHLELRADLRADVLQKVALLELGEEVAEVGVHVAILAGGVHANARKSRQRRAIAVR